MDDNDVMMTDRIEDALRSQVAALQAEVERLRARPQEHALRATHAFLAYLIDAAVPHGAGEPEKLGLLAAQAIGRAGIDDLREPFRGRLMAMRDLVREWVAKDDRGLSTTTGPDTSEERSWTLSIDGVHVDRQNSGGGWALFSGSEGEAPSLRAFFPGPGGQALAYLLAQAKELDGDEEVAVIFDPCVVPALLVSGLDTDGGLFTANDSDNEKAISAMAMAWGHAPREWG